MQKTLSRVFCRFWDCGQWEADLDFFVRYPTIHTLQVQVDPSQGKTSPMKAFVPTEFENFQRICAFFK